MDKGYVIYKDDTTMVDIVRRFIQDQSHILDSDDAFSLMDLGYHVEMVDKWKQLLPRVVPFFAVKCEPDPIMLKMMAQMNFGFDCASKKEIELVIGLGVNPSRIIYAHPRKQPSHLRYASSVGVDKTVFDDEDELSKIEKNSPEMKLLLRLSTEGFTKTSRASMVQQYGCPISKSRDLLLLAKKLGLNVCGVSYHIGVSPRSIEVYSRAIRTAKGVFQEGESIGFNMEILDVGGGFPSNTTADLYRHTFKEVADVINNVTEEEFGGQNVKIIAEPGALFTLPSSVLVTNIVGTKKMGKEAPVITEPTMEYFINDGLFSSFRYYHAIGATAVAKPVKGKGGLHSSSDLYRSRIWGQALAGDMVINECMLPEMESGDWLYFTDMGGYCHNMHSTGFNGFSPPPVHRFIRQSAKNRLDELITTKPFSSIL